ncbi:Cysteine protease StiP [Candidatus Methylobacter favarea]|uniref:Cysteine protease StiP n=1 Tax=Candidatus Methylobacter favarea TaxID=2707345 RepID=A0A8S0XIF1_9GAMM|nr:cysteine protease StiP domain-containing protein [Candidatus Methylobacter favarea]CAA9890666.1 Cysteine protease StiP [Candidatus Methylobacter favarea]
MTRAPFTGSYALDDVQFLLKPITVPDTPVEVKESLIQSGRKHYSEMLTHESLPSDDYLGLFYKAMALNQDRMANHLLVLAERILATRPHGITLVSLARAGTPIGVLLKHVLKRYLNREAAHYSISIIRDIGIDQNALRFILRHHSSESLVFVDGWTGKGVIARQLQRSLDDFAAGDGIKIPAELYVLTDLSGFAAVAASSEDYLIPSSILNATVSGLTSRSVYDKNQLSADDFHGCLYYDWFAPQDLSKYFIDAILARTDSRWKKRARNSKVVELNRQHLQSVSKHFLQWIASRYGITNHNHIKPGIGEATRVLLRRQAQLLLLKETESEATRHLQWLAKSRHIPVEIFADIPYRAAALIREVKTS